MSGSTAKEQHVYEVFQEVAPGYDSANVRISAGQQGRWKRAAVELLVDSLPKDAQTLDIGCGTGDMLLLTHQACPEARLTGLDFSPNMLEVARKRCQGIPDLSLVQGNALELPFEDATFDGATFAFALRNTDGYERALAEALRVLKPGAPLVCLDSFVPANPAVRPFYHLYFSVVMPFLGGGLHKLRQYRWLSNSTKQFLSVRELEELMVHVGFVGTFQKSYMMGACGCVVGRRPAAHKDTETR